MLKRLSTLAVLVVSAVVLGGCLSIQSIVSDQQDIVGKLRLTFTICASDVGVDADAPDEDHPGCPDLGNGGLEATTLPDDSPLPTQVLFGLRVPTGTGTPATLSATPTPAPPAAGTILLHRNASYESVLQAASPAPAGSVWVGYMSDPYLFDNGVNGVVTQSTQMSVDLELPPTGDGGPFVGPLPVRPVLGSREVSDSLPADRPVECGDDPYRKWPRGFLVPPEIVCIDTPTALQIASNFNFATRDFGVLAGRATASPGQTVTLPFNVRGAGALPAGLTAALSATTSLPGAGAVKPSVGSAALSNGSDTRATVSVTIPEAAGPGVFDVSLTGRLDNGQARTGVAKLTVRDRQKPVLTRLKAKPKRFKAATKRKPRRGTNVAFTLSEAAKVRLTVERCAKRKRGRCVRWATLKGGLTKPGVQGANEVRFDGRLRGKALKAGGYRLVLKPTDGAGNVGKVVRAPIVVRG